MKKSNEYFEKYWVMSTLEHKNEFQIDIMEYFFYLYRDTLLEEINNE